MIVFPNAKINLGLSITDKRTDGYHTIKSIFYPISIYDVLEFLPNDELTFETSGLKINGSADDNLIIKAFHLLKERYNIPNLKIHLYKNIPMGAGLGGGSADVGFFINAINGYFDLNISISEREKLALSIGSDCPFFIENKAKYVTGRGELMDDISLDLKGYYLVVLNPKIHISTKEAYSLITPKESKLNYNKVNNYSTKDWKNILINDFEKPIVKKYPLIGKVKEDLYKKGAIYASMTGSGSTVYGIFKEEINLTKEFKDYDYFGAFL